MYILHKQNIVPLSLNVSEKRDLRNFVKRNKHLGIFVKSGFLSAQMIHLIISGL